MENNAAPRTGAYRSTSTNSTLSVCAALAYARAGIPVFRLRPETKEPFHGSRGFYDATTDPETISRWWLESPDANIAYPTGKPSGLISFDHDTYKPDSWNREDIERELGLLPPTFTVRTGRGGQQKIYRYPVHLEGELRNGIPENELGQGICVKADGGYVVAPPSVTEGPYEVLEKLPVAEAPEWLIEALRKPQPADKTIRRISEATGSNLRASSGTARGVGPSGSEPIPEGERNWTLYRIGCSLRARGSELEDITNALHETNLLRCESPIPAGEVEKIANSAAKFAPGKAAPEVTPETLEALDAIEVDIMRSEWPGMGGKSERDVMIALTRLTRMYGTIIPAGVRVSVDIRTLALMAAVSKRSLLDNRKNGKRIPGIISRLKAKGWLRSDNGTRSGKEAGAMVLPTPAQETRARLHHSTTSLSSLVCGATLRGPTAARLRWSKPIVENRERVGTISRLGKTKGAIVDHLEAAGGTLNIEELAHRLGISRPRDLRRRHLETLKEAEVVECTGDIVSLTVDWLDALNERREMDGEIDDYRRDMARYEREREAYRNREKQRVNQHPANAGADGYIEELGKVEPTEKEDGDLENLPTPPDLQELYRLVNKTVRTKSGRGVLWQVFSDRVGVVLDSNPDVVTFFDPSELALDEAA